MIIGGIKICFFPNLFLGLSSFILLLGTHCHPHRILKIHFNIFEKGPTIFHQKIGVVNSVAISDGQQLLLMLYYSH
jgi:hypothetical protein